MDRRAFIGALAGGFLAPLAAGAQQAEKVWRIGFLGAAAPSVWASRVQALRAGLRDLGYVEGKNIVIEFRWANGMYDRLPDLAAELARLKIDVLVTAGTPGALSAKQATTTIPIVMAVSGDAVATGLVASLARPGGNITGSTSFSQQLHAKRLELLKEALPHLTLVGVLFNPRNPAFATDLQEMEIAARSMKVRLQRFETQGPNEFAGAFAAMGKSRVDAVVIQEDGMLNDNTRAMADLAAQQRLSSIGLTELADAGGLMGYGVNRVELFRRAAYFVDKILKGAKPADLPIEQPTKFKLVINLKTAKALGLTIPPSLLQRADQVIE
jgi:putative ABC transport system substrate-binding protein